METKNQGHTVSNNPQVTINKRLKSTNITMPYKYHLLSEYTEYIYQITIGNPATNIGYRNHGNAIIA